MKLKGFNVTLARHLGFRDTKEGDLDLDGYQVGLHETAFVSLKDCRIYEKDGKKYYDASEAPAIPTANGGSYYGYGAARKSTGKPRRFDGKIYYEFWTRPVYFAHDGRVYQGTCYLFEAPNDWPVEIRVSSARSMIRLFEELLPYLEENQRPETTVGRVQHAKSLINYLQEKLDKIQPKVWEE